MRANNNIEENDLENEKEELMAKKRKKVKSMPRRQQQAAMSKIKSSGWVTKSYGETSSATFYVPKIKIPKAPKFPTPKYPLYPTTKRKTKKRR